MNDLARQAQAIINALPLGSGVNPIGVDNAYPWPPKVDQVEIYDEMVGFTHWMDWYTAYPVPDKSGLFGWTNNAGGTRPVPGLSYVQNLAYQVMANGGNTSWSADFSSSNPIEQAATTAPAGYVAVTAPLENTATPVVQIHDLGVAYSGDASIHGTQDPSVVTGTIHQDPTTGAYVPGAGPPVADTGIKYVATPDPVVSTGPKFTTQQLAPASSGPAQLDPAAPLVQPPVSSGGKLLVLAGIGYVLFEAFGHG